MLETHAKVIVDNNLGTLIKQIREAIEDNKKYIIIHFKTLTIEQTNVLEEIFLYTIEKTIINEHPCLKISW